MVTSTDSASPTPEESRPDPDPSVTPGKPDPEAGAADESLDAGPTTDPDLPDDTDLPAASLATPAEVAALHGPNDGTEIASQNDLGVGVGPGSPRDVAAGGGSGSALKKLPGVDFASAAASSDQLNELIVQGHEAFDPNAPIDDGWDAILPGPVCACRLSDFGAPLIGGQSRPDVCVSVRVEATVLRALVDQLHVTPLRRGDDFVRLCLLPQGLAGQSFDRRILVQSCVSLDTPCPDLNAVEPLTLVVQLYPLTAALGALTGVITLRLDGPNKRLHVESDLFACPLIVHAPERFALIELLELGPPLGPPVKLLPHAALDRALAYVARASVKDDLDTAFATVTVEEGRAYAGQRSCVAVVDDPTLSGVALKLHHTLVPAFLQGLATLRPGGVLTTYKTMLVLADETTAFGFERSDRTFPMPIQPLLEPATTSGRLFIPRSTLIWALTLMKRALRGGGTGKGTGKGRGKQVPPTQESDTLRLRCAAGFPEAACELTGTALDGRRTRVRLTATRRGADEMVLDVRLSLTALLAALEAEQVMYAELLFAHGGKPDGDASDPSKSYPGTHETVWAGPAAVIVREDDDRCLAQTVIATVRPPPAKRRSLAGKTTPVPSIGLDDPSPLASEA